MVTPQISGLVNADVLSSLAKQGITCATGDNTWCAPGVGGFGARAGLPGDRGGCCWWAGGRRRGALCVRSPPPSARSPHGRPRSPRLQPLHPPPPGPTCATTPTPTRCCTPARQGGPRGGGGVRGSLRPGGGAFPFWPGRQGPRQPPPPRPAAPSKPRLPGRPRTPPPHPTPQALSGYDGFAILPRFATEVRPSDCLPSPALGGGPGVERAAAPSPLAAALPPFLSLRRPSAHPLHPFSRPPPHPTPPPTPPYRIPPKPPPGRSTTTARRQPRLRPFTTGCTPPTGAAPP
jgi:hypothetical protein